MDVASRYKAAEAITSKESDEVSRGFAKIYRHSPLKWPQMLQVDPGREFMGAVTKAMSEHNVTIRRGRPNIHRDHNPRGCGCFASHSSHLIAMKLQRVSG